MNIKPKQNVKKLNPAVYTKDKYIMTTLFLFQQLKIDYYSVAIFINVLNP